MAGSARVTQIEALSAFRPELVKCLEELRAGLSAAVGQATRTRDWLERDRLPYWRGQVRVREELATRARTRMISRSNETLGGESRVQVEDKLEFNEAKRGVEEARRKAEDAGKWLRALDAALSEYRSAVGPLVEMTRTDLPKAIAALDAMHAALTAYAEPGKPGGGTGESRGARADGAGTSADEGDGS